jgi:uncharacterized glyoxalase superfamily protein PhnB
MSVAATVFVVQDVGRSVTYYRDVLGFSLEFSYGTPLSYASVERDGVVIHLQAAADTKRVPGQGGVYVFFDGDVDALFRDLSARGARIEKGPQDFPYGMRDFNVADLDGNDLCFGVESKAAASQ